MKYLKLLLVFIVTFQVTEILYSQEFGWNNLKWGDSINTVKTKYPAIKKIYETDIDFPYCKTYYTNLTDDPTIQSRKFIFENSVLIKVIEDYNMNYVDKLKILQIMLDLDKKYTKGNQKFNYTESVGYNTWDIIEYILYGEKTNVCFRFGDGLYGNDWITIIYTPIYPDSILKRVKIK